MTDLIPGVAQAKAAGRVGLLLAIGLVGLLGIFSLANVLADPFGWQKARTDRAVAEAVKAKAEAIRLEAVAAATADAARIAEDGARRETQTIIIREAARAAIQAAPGADARLDPRLVRAGNGELCKLPPYAGHPGCDQVRPADPAELPPAGSTGGPATP